MQFQRKNSVTHLLIIIACIYAVAYALLSSSDGKPVRSPSGDQPQVRRYSHAPRDAHENEAMAEEFISPALLSVDNSPSLSDAEASRADGDTEFLDAEISLRDIEAVEEIIDEDLIESTEHKFEVKPDASQVFDEQEVAYDWALDKEYSFRHLFSEAPLLADYALTDAECKSDRCKISVAVIDQAQAYKFIGDFATVLANEGEPLTLSFEQSSKSGEAVIYVARSDSGEALEQ